MKRSIRRSAFAVLALVAFTVTGCSWAQLVVQISDFETNQIQGMYLWRGDDEASPTFVEVGQLLFGSGRFDQGVELLDYTLLDTNNQPLTPAAPAVVARGPNPGDGVTLYFVFPGWNEAPGWIRVSTFNAVGESPLSDAATYL